MLSVKLILNSFAVLAAIFGIWKGGAAERMGALVLVANVVIGQTWHVLAPAQDDLVRLVNDGVTAMVLLAITVRYSALWMGGVMLLFAAQFSLHSYYLVMERPIDRDYAVINNINFNGVIFFMIIGTAVAWRRRVRTAAEEG